MDKIITKPQKIITETPMTEKKIDSKKTIKRKTLSILSIVLIAISIVAEIIQVTKKSKKQLEVDVSLLKRLAKENGKFVVSRIVEKSGSAPREQGSTMVVFSNGEIQGTVGGGAVENRVIEDSKKLLSNKEKRAQLFTHNLSNTKASELGMICGGSVKVLLTKFTS